MGSEGAQDRNRQLRERIRGNFDRGAAVYERFEESTDFFRRLTEQLVSLGPPLDGKSVLDVGCGTGASTQALRAAVGLSGRIVGIDVSLGMLRHANRRLDGGALLALMDGCRFAEGMRTTFDAVVYNAVLFMLPDARASLESAWQVLSPGGVVLISSLDGASLVPGGLCVPDLLAARGFAPGRHALSPWPKVREAAESLFGVVESRPWTCNLSAAEFVAFYGQEPMSAGLLPGVPYPERAKILAELAAEWEGTKHSIEQVWTLARAEKR